MINAVAKTRMYDNDSWFMSSLLVHLNQQAVLVDMEEGVVNEILQGALREVFDSAQLLTDVSGSGNNWWAKQ